MSIRYQEYLAKKQFLQQKHPSNQQIYFSFDSSNMAPPFFRKFDDNVSLRLHFPDLEDKDPEEDKFITVELRCKAGTTSTSAPSYKKKIKVFESGSPREYVDVLEAIEEIWKQNGVTRATEQVNTV